MPPPPPNRTEKEYLVVFNSSLTRIMPNKNAHVIVECDFKGAILSGALCRYGNPRGYRTGKYKINYWKSHKGTACPKK